MDQEELKEKVELQHRIHADHPTDEDLLSAEIEGIMQIINQHIKDVIDSLDELKSPDFVQDVRTDRNTLIRYFKDTLMKRAGLQENQEGLGEGEGK
jgi:hypothetical protein